MSRQRGRGRFDKSADKAIFDAAAEESRLVHLWDNADDVGDSRARVKFAEEAEKQRQLIASTPARTLAGAMAKLRLLAKSCEHSDALIQRLISDVLDVVEVETHRQNPT
jgi:hypothetical protein